MAIAWLFPRLARFAGQRARARYGRNQVFGASPADDEKDRLRHRHQTRDALEAGARRRRWLAVGGRLGPLSRATSQGGTVPRWRAAAQRRVRSALGRVRCRKCRRLSDKMTRGLIAIVHTMSAGLDGIISRQGPGGRG